MTLSGLRNTVLIGVILVAALAVVDAAGDGDGERKPKHPDERAVEIRYFSRTRFNTAGHFGSTAFSRANKTGGFVEHGVAKVGEVVYSHMWYTEDAERWKSVRCQVWQGGANITESTAGPDVHRDYTCWAEVKA